eukprot:symbB.v1.2.021040.t1/scaffold1797.1/size100932/7
MNLVPSVKPGALSGTYVLEQRDSKYFNMVALGNSQSVGIKKRVVRQADRNYTELPSLSNLDELLERTRPPDMIPPEEIVPLELPSLDETRLSIGSIKELLRRPSNEAIAEWQERLSGEWMPRIISMEGVFQLPENYIHNSLATFPGFFLSGHAERMMSGAPSCNAASRVHRYICESLQLVHSYDHPEREKACAGGLSKLNCPVSWNNHRRTSTVKFQERASSKASPAAELSGRQVDHLAVLAMGPFTANTAIPFHYRN